VANIAVTKQVLENGNQNYVASYQMLFDGAGTLINYLALDPTSGGDMGVSYSGNILYPGTHLKIMRVAYNLAPGFSVRLTWDATTPQDAWILYGFGKQNFMAQGGLFVPAASLAPYVPITGATGKMFFNSYPAAAPAATLAGTIEIWANKDFVR
jgi:hypothetical protein